MYLNLLDTSSLYRILLALDQGLAEEAQDRGCACGGKLHRANYWRKPRGAPAEVEKEKAFGQRLSFCCAEPGCRRRTTPGSVRFLGRRVYFGAVVVLVSVLRQGPNPTRLWRLKELVGVSVRTVRRWRQWWLRSFVESDLWRARRGYFSTPVDERQLPLSLLEAFATQQEWLQLLSLLRFVVPMTSSSAMVSHAI